MDAPLQACVSMAEALASAPIDANGNLTSDGTRSFEWDARNQLVAVTVGTHRSEFVYDGLQRRVRQIEKGNGVTTADTRVLWCETAICEERAADGVTVTRRAFGLGEQVNGQAHFFTTDHLGSVREVTDATGTLLTRYAFDPWGRRTVTAGSDVTTVGFTGHRTHTTSGLALTLYRGYDAGLARWVSEDPVGMVGGVNLYRYVVNPLSWLDPDGRAGVAVAQAVAFELNCIVTFGTFVNQYHRPNEQNNRYAHCLASCLIAKACPGGRASARVAEVGKEIVDTVRCLGGRGESCDSAWEKQDFVDNEYGRSCPVKENCFARCERLRNQPDVR